MTIYDVIVVGGGVMGLSAAWKVAEKAPHHQVLLLDQFHMPHSRGSSHGHSRIIRSLFYEPEYMRMLPKAYEMWNKLEREYQVELFRNNGVLAFWHPDKLDEMEVNFKKEQQAYERLNPEQLADRFPLLSEYKAAALFDCSGGVLLADKCMSVLKQKAQKCGVEIRDSTRVIKIIPGSPAQIIAEFDGQKCLFQARALVLCPGAWAGDLLNQIGLNLPLKPKRVTVLFWRLKSTSDRQQFYQKRCPCIIDSMSGCYFYSTPVLEYPDLIKIGYHDGPIIHPEARDENTSTDDVELVKKYVKQYWPSLHPEPAIRERCLYTLTPDENFIIDRHPSHNNIIIGAGFSGHGFKFAPVVGDILANLVLNEKPSFDITLFTIGRFSAPSARL